MKTDSTQQHGEASSARLRPAKGICSGSVILINTESSCAAATNVVTLKPALNNIIENL